MRRVWSSLVAFGILCCAVGSSTAQEFPSRPIRLVMAFGPGGLGDIVGRIVGQKMSELLGKPIVIENMPGAGGITAALAVSRAEPDGHSILWVSAQNSISATLFKSLPYQWDRDFTPIGPMGTFAYAMFVHKDSPLKTVDDAFAAAKADPSRFNVGSVAVGTAQHLSAVKFVSNAGLSVPVVPFRTSGEVVTALTGGTIQLAFENLPGVIGQIKGGSLRALAVSTEKRVPELPDVPALSERALPQYKTASWIGLAAHVKTPAPIVKTLNAELMKALRHPDVDRRLRELLIQPRVGSPDDLQSIYKADVALWRDVIVQEKIPLQ